MNVKGVGQISRQTERVDGTMPNPSTLVSPPGLTISLVRLPILVKRTTGLLDVRIRELARVGNLV